MGSLGALLHVHVCLSSCVYTMLHAHGAGVCLRKQFCDIRRHTRSKLCCSTQPFLSHSSLSSVRWACQKMVGMCGSSTRSHSNAVYCVLLAGTCRLPSETQLRRQKYQFFEKQCSEIMPGLYLAGDYVARNRWVALWC